MESSKSHWEQPKGLSVNGSSLVWVISCVFSIYLPIRDRYNLRAGFFFHNNNNKRWCCSSARNFTNRQAVFWNWRESVNIWSSVQALDVEDLKSPSAQLYGSSTVLIFPCLFNQSTWCWKLKVTFRAAKGFIPSVVFSCFLNQTTWCGKLDVTLGATKGFIPSVGFVIPPQSKHLMLKTRSHIGSSQGVYP